LADLSKRSSKQSM